MQPQQNQNIKVVVRIRPFGEDESKKPLLNVEHSNSVVIKDKKYTYDNVFEDTTSQGDVFNYVVSPMIEDIFRGYNCTIFAYGQTGSGKTYTMLGNQSHNIDLNHDPSIGCIPRAVVDIFDKAKKLRNKLDYAITVSFVELYNEEIRDMLAEHNNTLSIYNDPRKKGNVYIQNLKEEPVCSIEDLLKLLEFGIRKRHTASTLMNQYSSRSHTVFTISVNVKELTVTGAEICKTGKLNLVDLAGSENIGKSGAKEIRALEASNINKSLLTLGRVIKALVEKTTHIPYRESKLTRILQDSLGGSTKTCIIATVAPGCNYHEETLSTLDYAFRARAISNRPKVNQNLSDSLLYRQLNNDIRRVKKELETARLKAAAFYMDIDNYNRLKNDLEFHEETYSERADTIKKLNTELKELEDFKEHFTNQCRNLNEAFEKTKVTLKYYRKSVAEKRLEVAQERFVEQCYTNPDRQLKLINNANSLLTSSKEYLNTIQLFRTKFVTANNSEVERRENVSAILNDTRKYSDVHNLYACDLSAKNSIEQVCNGTVKKSQSIDHVLQEMTEFNKRKTSFSVSIRSEFGPISSDFADKMLSACKVVVDDTRLSSMSLEMRNFVNESINTETEGIMSRYRESVDMCGKKLNESRNEYSRVYDEAVRRLDGVQSMIEKHNVNYKERVKLQENLLLLDGNRKRLLCKMKEAFDGDMQVLSNLRGEISCELIALSCKINENFIVIIDKMKNFLGAHNHFISAINDEMKVFIGNVLEKAQQFREFLRTKLEQLDSTVADRWESNLNKLIYYNQNKCMELVKSYVRCVENMKVNLETIMEINSNHIEGNEGLFREVDQTIRRRGINCMKPITRVGNTPRAKQSENWSIKSFSPLEARETFKRKLANGEIKIDLNDSIVAATAFIDDVQN